MARRPRVVRAAERADGLRPPSDAELIRRAQRRSGFSWARFAVEVLGTTPRTLRTWRDGIRALPAARRRSLRLYLGLDVWRGPGRPVPGQESPIETPGL